MLSGRCEVCTKVNLYYGKLLHSGQVCGKDWEV